VAERYVAAGDGAELWTVAEGDGPAMALCQGGPGLWDYLGPVAAMVNDLVRVVRWDQRGCGRSAGGPPYTVARFVDDLDAVRAAYGFEHWIVGGHSWGATLALAYALQHPRRTQAIVYMSGTGIGQAWNRAYHQEADRRRTLQERDRLAELTSRARNAEEEREYRLLRWAPDVADRRRAPLLVAGLDAPYAINLDVNRHISAETKAWNESELAERCRRIRVPVLLIHGDQDPRPPWSVDSLAHALPEAVVKILPDVGHLPWLEAPAALAALLRAFLAAL
jgi:proline iminopeptidase